MLKSVLRLITCVMKEETISPPVSYSSPLGRRDKTLLFFWKTHNSRHLLESCLRSQPEDFCPVALVKTQSQSRPKKHQNYTSHNWESTEHLKTELFFLMVLALIFCYPVLWRGLSLFLRRYSKEDLLHKWFTNGDNVVYSQPAIITK